MSTPPTHGHKPLLKGIEHLLLGMQQQGSLPFIMAQPTYADMLTQPLPRHVKIVVRQTGPRIAKRISHHINNRQAVRAVYPEDGMEEVIDPAFAFVIHGQADIRVGDYVLSCRPGDAVFFPAGIPKANSQFPHFEGNVSGRSCDILWVTPSLYIDGLRVFICRSQGALHLPTTPDYECVLTGILLKSLFEELATEIEQNGATAIFNHLVETLILLTQNHIAENKTVSSYSFHRTLEVNVADKPPMEFACDYIIANLHTHLTLTGVARHCYLSPSAFTQRFREHVGKSFLEYLTQQRMIKARHILEETDWRVADISRTVGLKESRFRQLFIEHYGQSPMNFRKSHLR